MRTKLLVISSVALMTAACSTSTPASVQGVKNVVGGLLPGTAGKTVEDQNNIDDTVARGCSAAVYSKQACRRHTVASAERRKELAQ